MTLKNLQFFFGLPKFIVNNNFIFLTSFFFFVVVCLFV